MSAEEIIIDINKLIHGSVIEIDLKTFQRTERRDFKTEITLSLSGHETGHTFKAENLNDLKIVLSSLSNFNLDAQLNELSKEYHDNQPVYITVTRNLDE